MVSSARRNRLFLLSFALWSLNVCCYLLSFFWPEMYRWNLLFFTPLFLGMVYPFFVMGREIKGNIQNLAAGLFRQEKRWLLALLVVSLVIAFASFLYNGLIVLGQGGGECVDGVFWRSDHGNLIAQITEAEYLRLRGAETRLMLGHLFVFLALPAAWFGQKEQIQ